MARKSKEVPELKSLVTEGKIHLSNARKIVSVLTADNKGDWLLKAQTLPQRQLEREITRVQPKDLPKERVRPLQEDRLELRVTISSELEGMLTRIKDLLSQKRQKPSSLEEVLLEVASHYLKRHDPIEKAKRALGVRPAQENSPTHAKHTLALRDQGQCTFRYPDGKRCSERRWLDRHHLKSISEGGQNTIENLTTLCRAHHRYLHSHVPAQTSAGAP